MQAFCSANLVGNNWNTHKKMTFYFHLKQGISWGGRKGDGEGGSEGPVFICLIKYDLMFLKTQEIKGEDELCR